MNLIPFGHLIKPHGLNGCISCRFFNKESRVLHKNIKIYFNNDINNFLTVQTINYDAKNYLIKFFEVFGRDKIENYRNCTFYVHKNDFVLFVAYIKNIVFLTGLVFIGFWLVKNKVSLNLFSHSS